MNCANAVHVTYIHMPAPHVPRWLHVNITYKNICLLVILFFSSSLAHSVYLFVHLIQCLSRMFWPIEICVLCVPLPSLVWVKAKYLIFDNSNAKLFSSCFIRIRKWCTEEIRYRCCYTNYSTPVNFTVASVTHLSQSDSLFLTIFAHQELEKRNYSSIFQLVIEVYSKPE